MKLIGKVVQGTKMIKETTVVRNDNDTSFRDLLEEGLIQVCKELDIQVPIWLKKNTTEFANYHKTTFEKEQFVETINFDKFELTIEL